LLVPVDDGVEDTAVASALTIDVVVLILRVDATIDASATGTVDGVVMLGLKLDVENISVCGGNIVTGVLKVLLNNGVLAI